MTKKGPRPVGEIVAELTETSQSPHECSKCGQDISMLALAHVHFVYGIDKFCSEVCLEEWLDAKQDGREPGALLGELMLAQIRIRFLLMKYGVPEPKCHDIAADVLHLFATSATIKPALGAAYKEQGDRLAEEHAPEAAWTVGMRFAEEYLKEMNLGERSRVWLYTLQFPTEAAAQHQKDVWQAHPDNRRLEFHVLPCEKDEPPAEGSEHPKPTLPTTHLLATLDPADPLIIVYEGDDRPFAPEEMKSHPRPKPTSTKGEVP